MTCSEARDAMLAAEPAELRGVGGTALAGHLAACEECRATGAALDASLNALATKVMARSNMSLPVRRGRRRRTRIALLAGLPIAAGLVAALVITRRPAPVVVVPPAPSLASHTVSVDVAPGQRAAVFSTKDPTVTVIWLSPGAN